LLEIVRKTVPKGVNCIYIRQSEALGLGHAVMCAEHVVSDEAFAVILADDLLDNPTGDSVMKQMVDVYNYNRCSVLGTMNVPRPETRQYGIVSTETQTSNVQRVTGIVEKPKPEEAPTTQAVVGRYILTPRVFDHLHSVKPGAGGEIQLTDAIASLLKEEAVLAYQFDGVRYDCGSKLGYLEATVAFGLRHPEVGQDFAAMLRGLQ
jgi:UTP--glucose-1-phosphate uridylyltransferase